MAFVYISMYESVYRSSIHFCAKSLLSIAPAFAPASVLGAALCPAKPTLRDMPFMAQRPAFVIPDSRVAGFAGGNGT